MISVKNWHRKEFKEGKHENIPAEVLSFLKAQEGLKEAIEEHIEQQPEEADEQDEA